MKFTDLTNGLFELIGSIFLFVNVFRLWIDKKIRGLYWPFSIFFTLWGFWNLYYYPTIGQMFSFVGGIFMSVANLAWIYLAIKYRKN